MSLRPAGGWARWPLKVPSNPKHSMIHAWLKVLCKGIVNVMQDSLKRFMTNKAAIQVIGCLLCVCRSLFLKDNFIGVIQLQILKI